MNTNNFFTRPITVCLLAMLCSVLWGSAYPCVKIAYDLFQIAPNDTATILIFAGTRFTFAGIFTLLIGSLAHRRLLVPKKENIGILIKLALVQVVVQYFFFNVGVANTSGIKTAIITGTNVFLAILISSLIVKLEKLTWLKIIGCIFGFSGVVLVNLSGGGLDANFAWNGEAMICMSTLSSAISSVMLKFYGQSENPITLNGYAFAIGGIILMGIGFCMGGAMTHWTPQSFGILFYLVTLSTIAYTFWAILLKYNPVSQVTIFGFMNPVAGVILSAVLLDETHQASGITTIIALVLVSLGIFVVNKQVTNKLKKD